MICKRVVFVTLLAVFGYVNPAHAITATLSAGTSINPDSGAADGGTFTTQPYTTTTTFNSVTPTSTTSGSTTTYTYTTTPSNSSAPTLTYTWTNAGTTSIRSDQYAPPPPNGKTINQTVAATGNNTSKYLAVFSGSPVTITSSKLLNYIGIDWGYADQYNQIQFYNTNVSTTTPIASFVSTDFFGSPLPNPEGSTYADFRSTNTTSRTSNDFFNKIVLTETSSGSGFETDNYAVRVAPAPSSTCGIIALGAMGAWNLFRSKRKQRDQGAGVRGQGTQA